MAIKVMREDKKVINTIGKGSLVRAMDNDLLDSSAVYMIVEDLGTGFYRLLNVETGIILESNNYIKDLVDMYSLKLITNNADIILKNM